MIVGVEVKRNNSNDEFTFEVEVEELQVSPKADDHYTNLAPGHNPSYAIPGRIEILKKRIVLRTNDVTEAAEKYHHYAAQIENNYKPVHNIGIE